MQARPILKPISRGLAVFALLGSLTKLVHSQTGGDERGNNSSASRFRSNGTVEKEGSADSSRTTEAPTAFDNRTNGYLPQGPAFETLNKDNVVASRSFNDNRFLFEEIETAADGLGPTYNAQSCNACHQSVVTGGASQITEHRTGRTTNDVFFEFLGGSLIQSRATNPDIVERVAFQDDIRTFRISTNTLGAGYIECIASDTLTSIRDSQPADQRGTAIMVPVLEGNGSARVGRFGWKSQQASLQSFSADAYLNEMGITNPLFPEENTSSDRFVDFGSGYDTVADPEDDGEDVTAFTDFMRSTKAPSRGPITPAVQAGETVFHQTGCDSCHVSTIATAAPGASINGRSFNVPDALGNKIIHPYSDFLLHDIGTGDGIPILPTPEFAGTANQMRTAPLWALRTRNRLMHDGLTFTNQEAIMRHGGQATAVRNAYVALSDAQKTALLAFLDSL